MHRYVHIATGNYNPTTSRVYTDIGIFTADPLFGEDATNLFNYLTGYSRYSKYHCLLVAPVNLRERMIALVERETEHARVGRPASIIGKVNSLTDVQIISALYSAAQAGVSVDLVVRGVCMLRPGMPGVSDEEVSERGLARRVPARHCEGARAPSRRHIRARRAASRRRAVQRPGLRAVDG